MGKKYIYMEEQIVRPSAPQHSPSLRHKWFSLHLHYGLITT